MKKTRRRQTYLAVLFLTFYSSLPAYISSSFLAEKISEQATGLIYAAGSMVIILAILYSNHFLSRFGLLKSNIFLTVLATLAIIPLVISNSLWLILTAFILYYALGAIIRYHLDIYLENISTDAEAGRIRAWSMTALNLAWLLSPLLATWLLGYDGYGLVYLVAGLILFPFIILQAFIMPEYFPAKDGVSTSIWQQLKSLWRQNNQSAHNLQNILWVDFVLNFFYTLMIIYLPIHLHATIGLSWPEIGLAFSVMLLPFVLFELPLGRLADKIYGEKEILIAGLALTGLTTIIVASLESANWIYWAILLFANRTGAAAIEIMKEAYLFKKIDASDVAIIGLSRLNSPLSSLVGPLFGVIILSVANFQWLFIALSLIVLLTIINANRLVDTR